MKLKAVDESCPILLDRTFLAFLKYDFFDESGIG